MSYAKQWYVLQVLSGGEDKVALNLETLKETYEKEELFKEIIGSIKVPIEEVYEVKNGKKKKVKRKIFPGYVLIEIGFPNSLPDAKKVYSDVVSVSGVGTFIGGRKEGLPEPMAQKEVDEILMRMGEKKISHKVAPLISIEVGDKVRVIEGPFKELSGKVESVDSEKNRLRVKIEIFGMPTPVDLEILQVEKI